MRWTNPLASDSGWHRHITNRVEKEKAAKKLALRLKDGDIVGVGGGSTCYITLLALAKRRDKEKLHFCVITASVEMEFICAALNIPVTSLRVERPYWSFDGADEVDPNNNLIKGRGGALLREKLLLKASPEVYIVVDKSKKVKSLGKNFPVPVEVHPEAVQIVESSLLEFKEIAGVTLRQAIAKDGPIVTERGNFIFDVRFKTIPLDMESRLKLIVGVVETGLFIGYPVTVI